MYFPLVVWSVTVVSMLRSCSLFRMSFPYIHTCIHTCIHTYTSTCRNGTSIYVAHLYTYTHTMKPQCKISWWWIWVKPHQNERLFEARASTATWMSPLYTLCTNSASCFSSVVFAFFQPNIVLHIITSVCALWTDRQPCVWQQFVLLVCEWISVERCCTLCKQRLDCSEITCHHILFLDS